MKEPIKIDALTLYHNLLDLNLSKKHGYIAFSLDDIQVTIDTTDTVGITLQSWTKQYLLKNNIFFIEPTNTQEFPDFYLDKNDMLEVKSFNYLASPAFDIANFESYCESVSLKPYRLDANYLIYGYIMSPDGAITIPKIWLKKIWEISGTSSKFPLKTQVKRNVIYNIRPNTNFKNNTPSPFNCKEDFLNAIFETLIMYRGIDFASNWLQTLCENYKIYYKKTLILQGRE